MVNDDDSIFRKNVFYFVTREIFISLSLAAFAFLAQSCATNCCQPEKTPPPPQSRFIRSEIPMPGSEKSYPVWRTRSPGKPVLLLHALNGISPKTLLFALEMEGWGYRVYLPSLYGQTIGGQSAFGYDMALNMSKKLKRDPDWNLFDSNHPGSILEDVAKMSRWVAQQERGRDLTVIGNCLTGNFPLALLDQPAVKTVVLAQPALPVVKNYQVLFQLPQFPHKRRSLALPQGTLDRGLAAMKANPKKRIVGFHYSNDPLAAPVKFDTLHRKLKLAGLEDRFTAYVLSPENSNYAETRDWVMGGVTAIPKKLLVPHSTLINPESLTDREWFRNRLRGELRR